MQTAQQIAAITEIRTALPTPPHEPVDLGLLAGLIADMRDRGWQGPPLVVDGDQALTGSHRIAAVARLINQHGIGIAVPCVEATELCVQYGLDWDAIQCDGSNQDWFDDAVSLRELLPAEIAGYLGLDADYG